MRSRGVLGGPVAAPGAAVAALVGSIGISEGESKALSHLEARTSAAEMRLADDLFSSFSSNSRHAGERCEGMRGGAAVMLRRSSSMFLPQKG